MHRIIRRVANYSLLRRSITSIATRSVVTTTRASIPIRQATVNPFVRQLQSKRIAFMSTSSVNTAYKETPFLKWKLFPDFEHLVTQTTPAIAVPAFEKLIDAAKEQFLQMEKTFEPTYEGTIGQLSQLEDEVSRAYGILSHLNGVKNSADVRATLEKIQPEFVKLGLMMNQSESKYKALETLRNTPSSWEALDSVQQRIVDHTLRGMKHAGIGFTEGSAEKKRFNEISERLSQLSLQFGNNVLDATKAFQLVIKDKEELSGCSDSFLETLKKNAERNNVEGYCITLDFPIYGPFMMNCSNRELREKVYRANITKASEGRVNNEPIINEILTLKKEKASLLGYETPADLSLSVKMAQTLEAAESLLNGLFKASLPHAKKELEELSTFAQEELNHPTPLQPWDTGYISEKYKKKLFKYDEETISEYFAFPQVMNGLFKVANDVLGIQVRELDASEMKEKNITVWHKDVKVFQVSEEGQVKAYFYGDFYSRPSEKRSGAWMDVVTTRSKIGTETTLPVAYLICNQAAPQSEDQPSLMKFRDVETLFHEFGHCLQHMMTRVDYAPASGINGIEWDFVEVASQFMENFCSEPEWIDILSQGHYKTGEKMPKDMVDALVKGREFMSGLATLRQLHFAKVDLVLHSKFTPPTKEGEETAFELESKIAKETVITPRLPEDRFLCSFNHIFGGGYSAGYYSYKWSETYSADAYAAFEEAKSQDGIEGVKKMGKQYRETILALGGGTSPQQVWKQFRGRDEVDIKALLRHSGLLKS